MTVPGELVAALLTVSPLTASYLLFFGLPRLQHSRFRHELWAVRDAIVDDIIDGRLTLGGRDIPLGAPVLPRLAAWLDYRSRTWPATINPHLFINRRTAPRLIEVSRPFPWKQVNLAPQTLREDRILDEIRATGGDIRRVCELFELSVDAAMRYAATLDRVSDVASPSSTAQD